LDPIAELTQEYLTTDTWGLLQMQRGTGTDYNGHAVSYDYHVTGVELHGHVDIDWYEAVDTEDGGTCYHGADIVGYYTYGDGDAALLAGVTLQWAQLARSEGGAIRPWSSSDNHVDNGGDLNSARYYGPDEVPLEPDGYEFDINMDATWSDLPRRGHPEDTTWWGGAHYETLLLGYGSIVKGTQRVIIYDGFSWGWEGTCGVVPEPATMLMLGCLGGGMVAVRKLRRKKSS
jgi:hypothetical protein